MNDEEMTVPEYFELEKKFFALKTEYEAARDAMGEEVFKVKFSEWFEKYPQMSFVIWKCYTPTFNDGDPCRFTVSGPEFFFKELEELKEDSDGDEANTEHFKNILAGELTENNMSSDLENYCYDVWTMSYYGEKHGLLSKEKIETYKKMCEEFQSFIKDKDTLEAVFGDGVCVMVSRNCIKTEDYYPG